MQKLLREVQLKGSTSWQKVYKGLKYNQQLSGMQVHKLSNNNTRLKRNKKVEKEIITKKSSGGLKKKLLKGAEDEKG